MDAQIKQATTKAIAYITASQKSEGGFDSYSSPSGNPFSQRFTYQTTFVPSLLLSALQIVDTHAAKLIRKKLTGFLKQQAGSNWTFNYWADDSPERQRLQYPDDLDDTFCALSALALEDPKFVQEKVLVAAVKILLATETKPGGPYRTWLVPPESDKVWLDVDPAVNGNIAYFLSLASEPLPSLVGYLDECIKTGALKSLYYPNAAPTLYYIARGYYGQQRTLLIKIIKKELKRAQTYLVKSLLVTAWLRLDPHAGVEAELQDLLHSQLADGSWPAETFCLDPVREGKAFYHGASVLTTAFAVEALQIFARRTQASKIAQKDRGIARSTRDANFNLQDLPQPLRAQTKEYIRRVAEGSSGQEITGLAYLFNQSLRSPLRAKAGYLEKLSLANLYGWAAYTIYDDFIDDEGQPAQLSVANVLHRRSWQEYSLAGRSAEFRKSVAKVFDAIDAANAWELANCRSEIKNGKLLLGSLPNYGRRLKLAERSLGHLLGPLAILDQIGISPSNVKSKQVARGLQHYLIARQLFDDAHDWQADIQQGNITYVVATILEELNYKPEDYQLSELIKVMQQQFWHSSLRQVCAVMQKHLAASRRQLLASKLFAEDAPLLKLVDRLDVSIQETLESQQRAEAFLNGYKKS